MFYVPKETQAQVSNSPLDGSAVNATAKDVKKSVAKWRSGWSYWQHAFFREL